MINISEKQCKEGWVDWTYTVLEGLVHGHVLPCTWRGHRGGRIIKQFVFSFQSFNFLLVLLSLKSLHSSDCWLSFSVYNVIHDPLSLNLRNLTLLWHQFCFWDCILMTASVPPLSSLFFLLLLLPFLIIMFLLHSLPPPAVSDRFSIHSPVIHYII